VNDNAKALGPVCARLGQLAEPLDKSEAHCHGELTVGLLDALRGAFGDEGLERVVEHRAKAQVERYGSRLPPGAR
jgi:predicted ArsR family transcriptional regulator